MQTRFIIFIIWAASLLLILSIMFYPITFSREYIQEKQWQDALKNILVLVIPQLTIVAAFIFSSSNGSALFNPYKQLEGGAKFAVIVILFYNIILSGLSFYFLHFDYNNPLHYYSEGVQIITLVLGIISFLPAGAMAYLFKKEN